MERNSSAAPSFVYWKKQIESAGLNSATKVDTRLYSVITDALRNLYQIQAKIKGVNMQIIIRLKPN